MLFSSVTVKTARVVPALSLGIGPLQPVLAGQPLGASLHLVNLVNLVNFLYNKQTRMITLFSDA
jgi:hypothetical protein